MTLLVQACASTSQSLLALCVTFSLSKMCVCVCVCAWYAPVCQQYWYILFPQHPGVLGAETKHFVVVHTACAVLYWLLCYIIVVLQLHYWVYMQLLVGKGTYDMYLRWYCGFMAWCVSLSLFLPLSFSLIHPPPSPSRYCRDIFERNYKTTIGVDFEVEKYKILGVPFHMQMWGQLTVAMCIHFTNNGTSEHIK